MGDRSMLASSPTMSTSGKSSQPISEEDDTSSGHLLPAALGRTDRRGTPRAIALGPLLYSVARAKN
jgi:hypothetical protein